LKRQWGFSYRNGPLKNKNQLCNDNFFLATGLGKKKSGTAASCLKQVKIYLVERLLDSLPLAVIIEATLVPVNETNS
jgi:hypothetical protein